MFLLLIHSETDAYSNVGLPFLTAEPQPGPLYGYLQNIWCKGIGLNITASNQDVPFHNRQGRRMCPWLGDPNGCIICCTICDRLNHRIIKLPAEGTYEMPVKSQVSARMECQPLGFNTKYHSVFSTALYPPKARLWVWEPRSRNELFPLFHMVN